MKTTPAIRERLITALAEGADACRKLTIRCREHHIRKGVHALRVATRQYLACLDLVHDLIPRRQSREAHRGLKAVLQALGPLRDTEVQRRQLTALAHHQPGRRLLEQCLRRDEKKLRREARSAMTALHPGKSQRRLVKSLRTATAGPPGNTRWRTALRHAVKRAREKLEARWPRTTADRAAFHRARIALKRYRYQLEALQAAGGTPEPAKLERLRWYQQRLGDLHDCEQMLDRVDQLAAQGKIPESLRYSLRPALLHRAARLRRMCLVPPAAVSPGRLLPASR